MVLEPGLTHCLSSGNGTPGPVTELICGPKAPIDAGTLCWRHSSRQGPGYRVPTREPRPPAVVASMTPWSVAVFCVGGEGSFLRGERDRQAQHTGLVVVPELHARVSSFKTEKSWPGKDAGTPPPRLHGAPALTPESPDTWSDPGRSTSLTHRLTSAVWFSF